MSNVPFRNDSGETIPAFGVMRSTGIVVVEGQAVVTVDKPNDQFQRRYYLNGPVDVPADGYGSAQSGDYPAFALITEKEHGDPQAAEHWGAIVDSWKLVDGLEGFTVAGGTYGDRDSPGRRTLVEPYDATTIVARLNEDLTDPWTSAKADVQRVTSLAIGSDFDTTSDTDLRYENSGVVARVFGGHFLGASVALPAGTIVLAHQVLHGNRFIIAATDVCGTSEEPSGS